MYPEKAPEENTKATPNWHAELVQACLDYLQVSRDGLTDSAVTERRATYGENKLPEPKQDSFLVRVFKQLRSPLTLVLLGACLLTFALAEYVDAGVIALALLIAVVVGLLQEGKASRAFAALVASEQHLAQVRRDKKRFEIPAEGLVPGDIVYLEGGMQVAADIRLLQVKNLSINEAALTGEWLAVDKQIEPVAPGLSASDQASMAFRGTYVASGSGLGVVVRTGIHTEIGSLATTMQLIKDVETPLQREVKKVSQYMLYLIIVLIASLFLIGVLQGQGIEEMLLLSVAIAVASVPEGLPAALTIILAVGMEALLKRGGLVKNLLAAETLGSTTFILTDKTGTLTYGKMSVAGLMQGTEVRTFTDSGEIETASKILVRTGLYPTNAFYDTKEKAYRGDAVEVAILRLADSLGIVEAETDWSADRLDFLPFTSEQRYAAGLYQESAGDYVLCVNGAPGTLLKASGYYLDSAGNQLPLTSEAVEGIRSTIANETEKGSRLIAVAKKTVLHQELPTDSKYLLSDLIFVGMFILEDPVRKDIHSAIAGVESAGARILLVTGDNAATALNVARQVGISLPIERTLTGTEIEKMSDDELLHAIDAGVSVFARVLPKQKMRLAQLLQNRGEIVAMTGDGINDALALQKANIGIAVGSGTEVAKEAADLVLVDDSFAVIYAAIEEGRRIVSNLKKVVGYLVSTSLSEVVLIGGALLTGASSPLTAVQILWANIVEEGFMSVAFAFEKGEKGAMQKRPQAIHKDGILSRDMLLFMAFCITVLSSLSLALYFYLRLYLQVPFVELQSAMFLSVAIDSMFMAFAFRSLTTPIWKIPLTTNRFFMGSLLFNVVLLTTVLSVPLFREFLSYQPLPLLDIMLVVGVSLASLVTIEVAKWVFFERNKKVLH